MKKMKVSLLCMLAGTLLFVGCQKQNEEGSNKADLVYRRSMGV